MSMFGEKKPMFIDLDKGIFGSFDGFKEDTTEKGYVYPRYVPLSNLIPRKITYTEGVPKECVHTVMCSDSFPGVEQQVVIVFQGKEGNLISFFDAKNTKLVQQLKEEIADLKMGVASAQQAREEAMTSASKYVSKVRELSKDKKDESSIFGHEDLFENV